MTDKPKPRTSATFGWATRLALTVGTIVVVGLGSLLVLFMGVAHLHEDRCPQLAPADATTAGYPDWVGPTSFRCAYGGGAASVEFRDTDPLGAAALVLTPSVGVILWVSHRLLVAPRRRRPAP